MKVNYDLLNQQVLALSQDCDNTIGLLCNVCALLKENLEYHWIGFYIVDKKSLHKNPRLILGPFQGPMACMEIPYGKGVCGASWKEGKILYVPDVELFPGHIACSSLSKSELVIPIINNDSVLAVLDIDSDKNDDFSQDDINGLEQLSNLLGDIFGNYFHTGY